jgi:hypothetical protein
MACRAALVGQAVHQHVCATSLHRGCARGWRCCSSYSLTRHTHVQRRRREMTGRASDGSDSYSYMGSVAVCGSAISGEASCAAEG